MIDFEKNILKRAENLNNLIFKKEEILKAKNIILEGLKNNNKIIFFGNGGSASDCNHISCEFISKFQLNRASLPSLSLCSNVSILTSVSNDFSFEEIFLRQIQGLGNKNDVLIGISTSAKSKNVLKALEYGKNNFFKTIFVTGDNDNNFNYDLTLKMPSKNTAQIQELYLTSFHLICEMIENELF